MFHASKVVLFRRNHFSLSACFAGGLMSRARPRFISVRSSKVDDDDDGGKANSD